VIALLDVNVLVALFDPVHAHHEAAHGWFDENRDAGWATCPITENGMARVLSHPSYPGRRTTVRDAIGRLTAFRESGGHVFWPDSATLCDRETIRPSHLRGHRQLTDTYLLALAVASGGRIATFDRAMPLSAVEGAEPKHVVLIDGEPAGPPSRRRKQDGRQG
jgi:hypothetical protein